MSEFLVFVCTIIFLIIIFLIILFWSIKKSFKNVPVVISVSNCEDRVEYELRKAIKENPGCDIVVVDLGSSDDTTEIIKKFSLDYSFVKVISLNKGNEGDIVSKMRK